MDQRPHRPIAMGGLTKSLSLQLKGHHSVRGETKRRQHSQADAERTVKQSHRLSLGSIAADHNFACHFLTCTPEICRINSSVNSLMRTFSIALITAAGFLTAIPAVEAKTTRTFSGSSPAEVEKNARKAGFSYPDGDMNCSSRCNQRWAKD